MKQMLCALAVLATVAIGAAADQIELIPVADNTMYYDPPFDVSNGAGEYLFTGRNAVGLMRRALLRFDLSDIPAAATISAATLKVYVSRTVSIDNAWNLHRVTAEWGEGGSDAGDPGGGGTASQTGDASWNYRIFDTAEWTTDGGDYVAGVSSSMLVGLAGEYYTFPSTPALVADLQSWLAAPAGNFGWIVIGDESEDLTAGRFSSRENVDPDQRPLLTISYEAPQPPCPGDVDGNRSVDLTDLARLLANFGIGQGATLEDGDLDGDHDVDLTDLSILLSNFGTNC